jgi:hypothetical protein
MLFSQIVALITSLMCAFIVYLAIEDICRRPEQPKSIIFRRCQEMGISLHDHTKQQLRLYARMGVFECRLYDSNGSNITRVRQDEQSYYIKRTQSNVFVFDLDNEYRNEEHRLKFAMSPSNTLFAYREHKQFWPRFEIIYTFFDHMKHAWTLFNNDVIIVIDNERRIFSIPNDSIEHNAYSSVLDQMCLKITLKLPATIPFNGDISYENRTLLILPYFDRYDRMLLERLLICDTKDTCAEQTSFLSLSRFIFQFL